MRGQGRDSILPSLTIEAQAFTHVHELFVVRVPYLHRPFPRYYGSKPFSHWTGMASPAKQPYQPLADDEIRLVRFGAGDAAAKGQTSLTLEQVSLDDAQTFLALSYV